MQKALALILLLALPIAGCAKSVKLGPLSGDVTASNSAAGAFVLKGSDGKVIAAVSADIDARTATDLLAAVAKAKLAGKLKPDQMAYVDALIVLLKAQADKIEK